MIVIEKEIELNGEDLAREFGEKNCYEQAEFFNQNKLKEDEWNHGYALLQIDRFVEYLDDNGREFIEKIYSSLQGWYEANKQIPHFIKKRRRYMLDNEVISEVLFRMTGEIHPIQETNYDDKAYENQEKIMFIIDRCIDEVMQNAERDDVYAFSVARSADRAKEYLLDLANHIHSHLGK